MLKGLGVTLDDDVQDPLFVPDKYLATVNYPKVKEITCSPGKRCHCPRSRGMHGLHALCAGRVPTGASTSKVTKKRSRLKSQEGG